MCLKNSFCCGIIFIERYFGAPNYTNIYTQENIKEQTSSGVDISFNQDSTIKINGIATEQTIFESNLFTFGINPNKWYNATLIKNSGDFSNITENGIKIQLLNENNVEFYSNLLIRSVNVF